jgi:hypothetical protein
MKKTTIALGLLLLLAASCKKKTTSTTPVAEHCTASNIDTTKTSCFSGFSLVDKTYTSYISKDACNKFYEQALAVQLGLSPELSFSFISDSSVNCYTGTKIPLSAKYKVSNDTVYITSTVSTTQKYTLVFNESCNGKLIDPTTRLKYYFLQ